MLRHFYPFFHLFVSWNVLTRWIQVKKCLIFVLSIMFCICLFDICICVSSYNFLFIFMSHMNFSNLYLQVCKLTRLVQLRRLSRLVALVVPIENYFCPNRELFWDQWCNTHSSHFSFHFEKVIGQWCWGAVSRLRYILMLSISNCSKHQVVWV